MVWVDGDGLVSVLTLLVVLGALFVLVIVHEAAHAVAAELLGETVREVQIGIGPAISGCAIARAVVSICALPVFGFVSYERATRRRRTSRLAARGRESLIASAGPLANLVLGLGLIAAAYSFSGVPADQAWRAAASTTEHTAKSVVDATSHAIPAQVVEVLRPIVAPDLEHLDRAGDAGTRAHRPSMGVGLAVWLGRLSILFALINLLPLPGLDGEAIVMALLPRVAALTIRGAAIVLAILTAVSLIMNLRSSV